LEEDEDDEHNRLLGSIDSDWTCTSAQSATLASLYSTKGNRLTENEEDKTEWEGMKHHTYLKSKLQEVKGLGRKEQEEAAVTDFEDLVTNMMQIRVVALFHGKKGHTRPLKHQWFQQD